MGDQAKISWRKITRLRYIRSRKLQLALGSQSLWWSTSQREEVPVETLIDRSTLEELRATLRGAAYAPSEEGYDEARKAWNLNAHQHPALVVMAAGAADVIAAVRLARDEGLGVGVMATGHGFVSPCDGGVLINTSRMKGVRVDPEAQTARVEPGALWTDVIPEAQVFGLSGLAGSSSVVGVVGYTMGGGFGWLGRKYGFHADIREHLAYVAEEMSPYETGATFVNFLVVGDWNLERTRASYSPEDFERLVELKDRYDPNNLFRFNRNIPPSSAQE
jgi:FAD/FMN-containing dehydrogenase